MALSSYIHANYKREEHVVRSVIKSYPTVVFLYVYIFGFCRLQLGVACGPTDAIAESELIYLGQHINFRLPIQIL